MGLLKISWDTKEDTDESITIRKKEGVIRGKILRLIYRDRDTRQVVVYLPALGLSGYGEDENKAVVMLKFNLKEWKLGLLNLGATKLVSELSELGWKLDKGSDSFKRIQAGHAHAAKIINAVANTVTADFIRL